MENNKEQIIETEGMEQPVKHRSFGKGRVKKPKKENKLKAFIKQKTAPALEFMRAGIPGGMIAVTLLATLMNAEFIRDYTYDKIPWIAACFVTSFVFVNIAELINLALKFVFGAGKRCKSYFFLAVFFVVFDNAVGTQANSIPAFAVMSYLLVLAVQTVGRCIWAFAAKRRFKQVFAYVVTGLSLIYLGLYGYFLLKDNFGEDRVTFYNQIPVTAAEQVMGFDAYLENGPYEVAELSYGPEDTNDIVTETLDFTVFDSVNDRTGFDAFTDLFMDYKFDKVPVKGQIWYPSGSKNCPVFFIVHGNHDSDVPSYLGYEYLGRYLASNGYVVVSVDENIINASSEGNDKRAILLLDNIKAIFELNKTKGSALYGLMNEDILALGGHSRGGEMVAVAYLFNDLDSYPEDGNIKFDYHFNITSIVAIAPVVDQYRPVGRSVELTDVNYLLIHGANDQDVSGMQGEKQYNNITFTGSGDNFYLKSSVYIYGANHGQFNSLWGRYDSSDICNNYLNTNPFIDEADQKLIAKAYIRSFLDSTLGIDNTYVSLMSDVSSYRSYLPETVYLTVYSDSDFVNLCSFDETIDITGDDNIATVDCTGVDTWNIRSYSRGDGGEGENAVLNLEWEEGSSPSVEVSFQAADISNGSLSFEIADMREDTADIAEGLNYSVELTDANGNSVTVDNPVLVYHSLAIQFSRQDALFGTYEYKHQLQQVTVDPSMFASSGFDFTKVVSMKITTDGTDAGQILINNIGYWN